MYRALFGANSAQLEFDLVLYCSEMSAFTDSLDAVDCCTLVSVCWCWRVRFGCDDNRLSRARKNLSTLHRHFVAGRFPCRNPFTFATRLCSSGREMAKIVSLAKRTNGFARSDGQRYDEDDVLVAIMLALTTDKLAVATELVLSGFPFAAEAVAELAARLGFAELVMCLIDCSEDTFNRRRCMRAAARGGHRTLFERLENAAPLHPGHFAVVDAVLLGGWVDRLANLSCDSSYIERTAGRMLRRIGMPGCEVRCTAGTSFWPINSSLSVPTISARRFTALSPAVSKPASRIASASSARARTRTRACTARLPLATPRVR
ncbi:Hypothetical protein UVM_LOCUS115 [uncultured virus]|nr:Hypothetical protein UVM_LOCUS115 [uncultured virus]